MDNLNLDNIEQLLQSEPSEKLLFKTIRALEAEKKNRKPRRILIVICYTLGSIVGIRREAVTTFRESIDAILNVSPALSEVIFTGYSLL